MSTSGRYKGRGVREIVAVGSGLGLGFGDRDFWDFWEAQAWGGAGGERGFPLTLTKLCFLIALFVSPLSSLAD